MGAEVYPVFHPRVPAASFDADGKLLLREHAALDSIARELSLTPFTAFGDNRDVPEDFDGDPDELDEILGEWDEWFSIDDGLETIDGMIAAIKTDPKMAGRFEEPDCICSVLESLANCLRIARNEYAQFRFEVS
ncbi:hypothetical protein [Stieleria varia]|uniref:Uncharacterized protein n=1 Tax=Stieleria varia TaxID=2528005 RepID=A0A5C5ZKV8_9BACT|nr:hypothetical protein [Stieleria varia]TWT87795.1 hypothetical protein Pla52n_69890 [Stieleria varia]